MGCSRCPFGAGQVQSLICYQNLSFWMLSLPFWSRTSPEINLLSKPIILDVIQLTARCERWRRERDKQKRWSGVSCPQQRYLQVTQICILATVDSVQFYLLCCQPGSIPASLSARTSRLTPWCPCRLSTWPRQIIHMSNRTYCGP